MGQLPITNLWPHNNAQWAELAYHVDHINDEQPHPGMTEVLQEELEAVQLELF